MKKRSLFIALLILTTTVVCFGYDYWYLDVDSPRGLNERQRAYFFKDLSAFTSASGYRINQLNFWETNENNNSSYRTIFGTMRREGFIAAFVLAEYSTFLTPNTPWIYQFYYIENGRTYVAVMSLPRRINMSN